MVQIIALLKPFRVQKVLEALENIPLQGGSVREVMGYGRQKNRLHHYLGSEFNTSYLPKVELSLFLDDADLPLVIRLILSHARTGRIGDGKIMVIRCHGESMTW